MEGVLHDLTERHSLQGDSFYSPNILTNKSRNASLLVGAFVMGIFIMFRILDFKLQKRVYVPLMQMTVWCHFLVGLVMLLHGFGVGESMNGRVAELAVVAVSIAAVVGVARALWFQLFTSSVFPMFNDIFTHLFVPVIAVLWFFANRASMDKGSIPFSVGMMIGVVGLWITLNLVLRSTRGVWVYGKDASDPFTHTGIWQSLALLLFFGGSFALFTHLSSVS